MAVVSGRGPTVRTDGFATAPFHTQPLHTPFLNPNNPNPPPKKTQTTNHPTNQPIDHLTGRYIAYARKYVHPRLSREAAAVLQEFFLRMRAEARMGALRLSCYWLCVCVCDVIVVVCTYMWGGCAADDRSIHAHTTHRPPRQRRQVDAHYDAAARVAHPPLPGAGQGGAARGRHAGKYINILYACGLVLVFV